MRVLLAFVLACMNLGAQVVQECFNRDPGPLDFIRGEGFEQSIMQSLCGDALVGLDAQGRLVPRLAERWEGRKGILHFHLRKDARFEDGSPVSAGDALWTLQAIQRDPRASATKRALLQGVEVRVAGDHLELKGDCGPERLLSELAQIPIAKARHPSMGCGPYALNIKGGEWYFSARDHFLHPRIPGLHFRLIADEQAVLQNLQKGWLTLGVPPARRGLVPPPSYQEIHQALNAQYIVWSRLGANPLRWLEHWRKGAIPEGLFGGKAKASRGLFPESLGFRPGAVAGDRTRPPEQTRWEMLYTAGDQTAEKLMLALRETARRDGLALEPRPVEASLLYDRLLRGDFQLACAVNYFDPHPWSVLDLLAPQGAVNFSKWEHPKLGALLPRLAAPGSPAWSELQALWAENPTSLPLLDVFSSVWVDRKLEVLPSAQGLYLSTPGAASWYWKP